MSGRISRQAGMLLGMCTLLGIEPAQAATLSDTPRAEFGCELSMKKVSLGITLALITRGWNVTKKESDGTMVAQIIVRGKHTLVVDIAYNEKSFDITYKSSDNLNYKDKGDGTATIHRNANKWMRKIHQDIAKQLVVLCLQ